MIFNRLNVPEDPTIFLTSAYIQGSPSSDTVDKIYRLFLIFLWLWNSISFSEGYSLVQSSTLLGSRQGVNVLIYAPGMCPSVGLSCSLFPYCWGLIVCAQAIVPACLGVGACMARVLDLMHVIASVDGLLVFCSSFLLDERTSLLMM